MHYFAALFLVPLAIADVIVVDNEFTRPKPRCPGGYKEGEEAVLGRYFYQCHDGNLDPKGCISDNGDRIAVWGTADTIGHEYRVRCVLDNKNLQFEYVACLDQGREYRINERWNDDKFVYMCVKSGDHLMVNIDGCMYEGHEVGINEKVRKGKFVYQCKQTDEGTCSMCPVGCVKSSREYALGETFEDGNFWYTCANIDSRITLKPNGCVSRGKRLNNSEHYFRNGVAYECQVNKDDIVEKVVGCSVLDDQGNPVERRLDSTWTDGSYDFTCKFDQATNTTKMVKVRCNYKLASGMMTVDAGCYRIQDGAAIGCLKDNDSLRVKVYRADEVSSIHADNLRLC